MVQEEEEEEEEKKKKKKKKKHFQCTGVSQIKQHFLGDAWPISGQPMIC